MRQFAIQQRICYIGNIIRPLRIEFAGAVYHLTSRGNAQQAIFFDEKDFADFLRVLCLVAKRYHFLLHTFCLMTIIIYLLKPLKSILLRGMKQLNGPYTGTIQTEDISKLASFTEQIPSDSVG